MLLSYIDGLWDATYMDECRRNHDSGSELLDEGERQPVHARVKESRPYDWPEDRKRTTCEDNKERANA